ncbi:MAG: tyrosine-type recombinase/integrase [Moheibacter sp.]
MASIKRRPDSRFWVASFRDKDGIWRQRSTGTADRKEAQRIADNLEDISTRKMPSVKVMRLIQEVAEAAYGNFESVEKSITDYSTDWIQRISSGEVAESTARGYIFVIKEFVDFLGTKSKEPIMAVNQSDIMRYRDEVAKKGTNTTANKKLKYLRGFFSDAVKAGFITENPADKVKVLKTEESTRRPFTLDELRLIMKNADNEWRGMILTGLYTGQRLGDVAGLTWSNIDKERRQFKLRTSKTGRMILLPIAEPLWEWMRNELESKIPLPNFPLFPESYKCVNGKLQVGTLSDRFYRIMASSGLVPFRNKRSKGKGRGAKREKSEISFHCLRHTATTLLKEAGVPESVVMDIIGHESRIISQSYTHVSDEAKAEALNKMPRLIS